MGEVLAMATFYDPMHMNGAGADDGDDRVHLQIRKTNATMVGRTCMHVAAAFGNFGVCWICEGGRWINLCIVRTRRMIPPLG